MDTADSPAAHDESRAAWNANAAFWDERMGDDGNDFVNVLIWPPTQRLLALQPGEHVLDACCGNGVYPVVWQRWAPGAGLRFLRGDGCPCPPADGAVRKSG